MKSLRDEWDDSCVIRSRSDAEAHVGFVCFKLGPPRLVGAELEWLVFRTDDRRYRPRADELASALGSYAPRSISPQSPHRTLPRGSVVSVEPGGQIEISSPPVPGSAELTALLAADAATVMALLERVGLTLEAASADRCRPPRRILTTNRYSAMESEFDRAGPFGRLMMTNTAAVQVCVDAGRTPMDVGLRWATLHEIGPALVAAFATSPQLHSAPPGEWVSQRMRSWIHLDPYRTRPIDSAATDPAPAYARWAVDAPLLCVRRDEGSWKPPRHSTFADWAERSLDGVLGRRPTTDDLDYHLSTLFPPVRPKGFLEVRYLDQQPNDGWQVPIAVVAALIDNPDIADRARNAALHSAGQWLNAARYGLTHPEIRADAVALLSLAAEHVSDSRLQYRVAAKRDLVLAEPNSHHPAPRSTHRRLVDMSMHTMDVQIAAAAGTTALRSDVRRGLSGGDRWLPPKWFYDAEGSAIFEEITELDEYYPTRTERSLLQTFAADIAASASARTLVELGSGSSSKTVLLLDALRSHGCLETYVAQDVSETALGEAAAHLARRYPGLEVHGVVSDFTNGLTSLPEYDDRLVIFLGGTIGNLLPAERAEFYSAIGRLLALGEHVLIGIGLITERDIMVAAYDDARGVTARFNRNVLHVVNRELAADFDVDAFEHVAVWDADNDGSRCDCGRGGR